MRRCARPGLFRTPSRSEDLLRAAAIKQRAQKTPVGWLGVCTPKQFRRTCTSVSPFFAMTRRRLGALAARDKFMHSPKSCRKNPRAAHSPQGKALSVASGLAPRWAAKQPQADQCGVSDVNRGQVLGLLRNPTRGKPARHIDIAQPRAQHRESQRHDHLGPSQAFEGITLVLIHPPLNIQSKLAILLTHLHSGLLGFQKGMC